jgi:hypothetical protein
MNTRSQEQRKRFESLTRDAVTRMAVLARRDCVHEKNDVHRYDGRYFIALEKIVTLV